MQSTEVCIQELSRALDRNESLVSIHYSCESFTAAKDHPAGIACIAIYDLQTGDTLAFSRADAPPSVEGDAREVHLLNRFYGELAGRTDARFLHWNMNRPEYGFNALAARYEYLCSTPPPIIVPERKFDVDALISYRFGTDYAPHGKLESVSKLNDLDMRSFKSGRSEADLFEKQDWGNITRSTASKAKIIGQVLELLVTGKLRTQESAGTIAFLGANLDAVAIVLELGQRMRLVERSLKVHPRGRPTIELKDEYDDQYLYRALLVQFIDDVRDEEYTPSYAGRNSRIDFLLPAYRLAIELKHTRDGLTDQKLGEQLIIDRDRYSGHGVATHLICLVFDYEGKLRNPRALEDDLTKKVASTDMAVTVRIYDR
jgi:REase_DpnII-MboI